MILLKQIKKNMIMSHSYLNTIIITVCLFR